MSNNFLVIPLVIDDTLHKVAAFLAATIIFLQVPDWLESSGEHPLMYPDVYSLSIQISAVYGKTKHQVNVFNIMIMHACRN